MSFLNPALLFGLLSSLIPVIIYLWFKRSRKEITVSSTFIFSKIEQSSIKQVKINEWLFLLLRTLALFFLSLAFSHPFFQWAFETNDLHPSLVRTVIIDQTPEMKHAILSSGYDHFFSQLSAEIEKTQVTHPTLSVYSTDSLQNFQFTLVDETPSYLHSFPDLPPKTVEGPQTDIFVTHSTSPVLKQMLESNRPLPLLFLVDSYEPVRIGIQSVTFPGKIWQTESPNIIEVTIFYESDDERPISLDVRKNDVFIQTVPLQLKDRLTKVSIPVQLTERGWHHLQLTLNYADFTADNQWVGAFFVPEIIPIWFDADIRSVIRPDAFRFALSSVGLDLQEKTSFSHLKGDDLVIGTMKDFPQWSSLPVSGILLPYQSTRTQISDALTKLGLELQTIETATLQPEFLATHPFWSFLTDKKIVTAQQPISAPLIIIKPSAKFIPLAFDQSRRPLFGLVTGREKQYLVFLYSPAIQNASIHPFILGTWVHALTWLTTSSLSDGFFADHHFSGQPIFSGSHSGRFSIRQADRQWETEALGPYPFSFPMNVKNNLGLLRFSKPDIVRWVGINRPITPTASLPDTIKRTLITKGKTPILFTMNQGSELSVWFFALSLLCFLLETILTRLLSK